MSESSGAECSFCGRSASEAGALFKGQRGMICEECSRVALNLAEDRREGAIDGSGRLEIGQFAADVGLAQHLGRATLARYTFVPLDVRDDHVVLAVANFDALNDLKQFVLDANAKMAATERQKDVVDFVLARPEAIMDKIVSIFSANP